MFMLMNKIFFIFVMILSAVLVHAATGQENKISGLREDAVRYLIALRCERYLPSTEKRSCFKAVDLKIELLNFDIIINKSDSFVFVAFKKDFYKLLSDPRTSLYLDELLKNLNSYLLGKNPLFNLWNFTHEFYQDKLSAARVLAILFQDTDKQLHLEYLKEIGAQGSTVFEANRELLERSIDTLLLSLNYRRGELDKILYPTTIKDVLNPTLYHFYVPLYLSMMLQLNGTTPFYARVAPLLMTLTYESVTYWKDWKKAVKDPERWDSNKDVGTMLDIFASLNAVHFGVSHRAAPLSFEKVRSGFNESTQNTMEALLKL